MAVLGAAAVTHRSLRGGHQKRENSCICLLCRAQLCRGTDICRVLLGTSWEQPVCVHSEMQL